MLLSHKTTVQLNNGYSNIVAHMCYSAYKLWNVCNYERNNHELLGLQEYPDWYYQKKAHKDDLWFKNLPSQTAQEVCKQLDKSWKSYFALVKSGNVDNPQPPGFKKAGMAITYMQNAIVHDAGDSVIRLSLPKQLMGYMESAYGISEHYLFLNNGIFRNTDTIKQIKVYPPENGTCRIIVIYEVPDVEEVPFNGHALSVDLGLHNLMTCYDNAGKSFILGREYLGICHRYNREIARVQSQWAKAQASAGVRHPKTSKHLQKLYAKKQNCITDYLHKITRWLADYCHRNGISVVVAGNITGIRKGNDKGPVVNQKLHSLPYAKLYLMLRYKLAMYGIRFVLQDEAYTSQCSPETPEVSKDYAEPGQRIMRGLYVSDGSVYNADCVGSYNIMRRYDCNLVSGTAGLSAPAVIKAAV